jgi:hypothetical protein
LARSSREKRYKKLLGKEISGTTNTEENQLIPSSDNTIE